MPTMPPKSLPKPKKVNPLRNKPPVKDPRAKVATLPTKPAVKPRKSACPNPDCDSPNVVDGTCHGCGTVVDDSNIVSEITFGETSNGAAMVQGTLVGANETGARSMGPNGRAMDGNSKAESEAYAKRMMGGWIEALDMNYPEGTLKAAFNIFKLCQINNFIQGRRMDTVLAVCLYSACRRNDKCEVMLIDFADLIKINVFKLGNTFKALHKTITLTTTNLKPVIPEDLMFRFASRLGFGDRTKRVAEDAIRLARRMSKDWIQAGRRPSGVCGACIVLAARMNNFRRTPTEVTYVVKVTQSTIQKRIEEFKVTPSSQLTVADFLTQDLVSEYDPPSFYQQTEEWQAEKNKKKRKRRGHDGITVVDPNEASGVEDGQDAVDKRQKTTTPALDQSTPLRYDADGFVIPAQPSQQSRSKSPPAQSDYSNIDPAIINGHFAEGNSETQINSLVALFGERGAGQDQENGANSASPKPPKSKGIQVSTEWENDENLINSSIQELISDPNTIEHAAHYALAEQRVAAHTMLAELNNPSENVNMDVHIGEDEFADDWEVLSCQLAPEEVAKKTQVWTNENKDWLRKQQEKIWKMKEAANGPAKQRRPRPKKRKIGERQGPADSAEEAAVDTMKERALSKKINYAAIEGIFSSLHKVSRNGIGSASTSRAASMAPSTDGDGDSVMGGSGNSENLSLFHKPKSATGRPRKVVYEPDEESDHENDDDYIQPDAERSTEEEPTEDWKAALKETVDLTGEEGGDGEDDYQSDQGEYDDVGGLDDSGIPDDVDIDDDAGFGDDEW